jgi:hypothetical protein
VDKMRSQQRKRSAVSWTGDIRCVLLCHMLRVRSPPLPSPSELAGQNRVDSKQWNSPEKEPRAGTLSLVGQSHLPGQSGRDLRLRGLAHGGWASRSPSAMAFFNSIVFVECYCLLASYRPECKDG